LNLFTIFIHISHSFVAVVGGIAKMQLNFSGEEVEVLWGGNKGRCLID